MHQVTFNDVLCNVVVSQYANNRRIRWDLKCADDGSPYATATINLPDEPLEDNQVHIKNHSENTGLLAALLEAELVEPLSQYGDSAHVSCPVVTVLHQDLLQPS